MHERENLAKENEKKKVILSAGEFYEHVPAAVTSLHYGSSVAHHTTAANSVQKTIFTLKI